MQEENSGITFKDIFRTIWLRKWVLIVVAVAVALVMTVALYYGYNPAVKTCEVQFSLNLPNGDGGATYQYPDGVTFHYAELTSAETLEKIKSNGEFSNVNVEKMVAKCDISINREVKIVATLPAGSADDANNAYTETVYTVSAKLSYFNDREQAKEFLIRVANYPAEYLKNMEIDYGVYLPYAKTAIGDGNNTAAVKYLNDQLDFLSERYDNLIKAYGETFVVQGGKTLLACKQEVERRFSADDASLNVEAAYQTVSALTYSFRMSGKAVYEKAASVVFVQPSVVIEKGGMGLAKTLLLSVVVAVIAALIAAYVAGYYKSKALKAAKSTPENKPEDDRSPMSESAEILKENKN